MTEQIKVNVSLDLSSLEKQLKENILGRKNCIEAWAGFDETSGVRHITPEEKLSNLKHHDNYFKDASYVDIALRQEYGSEGVKQRPFITRAFETFKTEDFVGKKEFVTDSNGAIDWKKTAENFANTIKMFIMAAIVAVKYAPEGKRTIEAKGRSTPLIWTRDLYKKAVVTRSKVK